MDSSVRKSGKDSMNAAMDRRQFLKWMGLVGAVAVVGAGAGLRGISSALAGSASTEEASSQTVAVGAADASLTTASQAGSSAAVSDSAASSTCAVRCRNACSYPGHCKRYTDSNGNGHCDYGECM